MPLLKQLVIFLSIAAIFSCSRGQFSVNLTQKATSDSYNLTRSAILLTASQALTSDDYASFVENFDKSAPTEQALLSTTDDFSSENTKVLIETFANSLSAIGLDSQIVGAIFVRLNANLRESGAEVVDQDHTVKVLQNLAELEQKSVNEELLRLAIAGDREAISAIDQLAYQSAASIRVQLPTVDTNGSIVIEKLGSLEISTQDIAIQAGLGASVTLKYSNSESEAMRYIKGVAEIYVNNVAVTQFATQPDQNGTQFIAKALNLTEATDVQVHAVYQDIISNVLNIRVKPDKASVENSSIEVVGLNFSDGASNPQLNLTLRDQFFNEVGNVDSIILQEEGEDPIQVPCSAETGSSDIICQTSLSSLEAGVFNYSALADNNLGEDFNFTIPYYPKKVSTLDKGNYSSTRYATDTLTLMPLHKRALSDTLTVSNIGDEAVVTNLPHLLLDNGGLEPYMSTAGSGTRIDNPGGGPILIRALTFSMESTHNCAGDRLEIYDGPDENATLAATWCGRNSKSFVSTGSSLYLKQVSDNSNTEDGFGIAINSYEERTFVSDIHDLGSQFPITSIALSEPFGYGLAYDKRIGNYGLNQPPKDDLELLLNFESSTGLSDSSSNQVTLSYDRNPVFQSGVIGESWYTQDHNHHLVAPDIVNTEDGMTLSFWLRTPPDILSGGDTNLFSKWSAGDKEWRIQIDTNAIQVDIYDGSSVQSTDFFRRQIGHTATDWQHYAFSYKTGTAKFYLNGEIIREWSIGAPLADTSNAIYIGSGSTGATQYEGYLDEVILFSEQLDADDIYTIANRQMNPYTVEYWLCDSADCSDNLVGSSRKNLLSFEFTEVNQNLETYQYESHLVDSGRYLQYKVSFPYSDSLRTYRACYQSTSSDTRGVLTDVGGNSQSYANNEDCEFTISQIEGRTLALGFISFETESGDSDCSNDRLTIYDGATTASPVIGIYCSANPPPARLRSTGPAVTVHWQSNGSSVNPGFAAYWEPVEDSIADDTVAIQSLDFTIDND